MHFFTLHVRLTRDCNAHCSYCSSAGVAEGRMSPSDFRASIDYIADAVFPRIGISKHHTLTIEYLGGEVLLVPDQELVDAVSYARARLRPLVKYLRDGAQSNLIGSERRVIALHDLFDGNLGTSWDQHTGQRNVKGSADLYRGLLHRSLSALGRERACAPGRVIVVDRASSPHIEQEVADAARGGYDLVLRPVFHGGSDDIDALSPEELEGIMLKAYRQWRKAPERRVEPFTSLFHRRATRGQRDPIGQLVASNSAGCPFQSDCALKSLSLDPDGQLFICQEMADSKNYPLGNAINQVFDEKTWRLLARRTARLSSDCTTCEWSSECGGGCMNEAIAANSDPFGKTELCRVWKALFASIENDLDLSRSERAEK